MKQPRKLHEVQADYKETVVGLCIVCKKPVSGFYGRWGDSGTCCKAHEAIQEAKPRYQKGEENGNVTLPYTKNT